MIEDEENVDQDEFHTAFIPTWCLDVSDDDFLCGENLPNHPFMIIQDESIDDTNTSVVMEQSETTTINGDKNGHELLQISSFSEEMETFTFDDIDELVIKRSVDAKDKNQLLGEEDEPYNFDSLSCIPTFTFHERCLGEGMMIQKGIDIIERIEDESYTNMKTSSSIPMEIQLTSFKVQRNPLFEPFHQIGNPMPKSFYEENNDDQTSNELACDLMEESDEGNSNDVFIPSWCPKTLDGNFFYGENVYFNPLFLDEGISIDTSQIGVQGQSSMAITLEIVSCHRSCEGNPIQGLISSSLNHQKDLQKENFDINGKEIEVMTNHADNDISVASQCLKI